MAKSGTTTFNQENVVAWYRETPGSACGTGGTTGNTASQLQQTHAPAVLAQDRIFYAALLGSPASVSASIGGQSVAGTWDIAPSGGVGLYRGSVPMGGRTGAVVVSITRSGSGVVQASGNPITTACTGGMTNWNPIVISGSPRSIAPATPLSLAGSVCTSGFGDPKYLDLCSFACRYGYCPSVCTCTSLGAAVEKPAALNVNGCPKAGMDSTYLGLCSFGCNYGYCPPSLCQVHPAGHVCTAPNPTAPPIPVCVSGMADGAHADLCSFSCYYGFCPPEICTCTQAGSATGAPAPPPVTGMVGGPKAGTVDYDLCQWACQHGNCPSHLCTCSGSGCPSGGGTPGGLFFQFPSKLAATQSLSGRLMGGLGFDWGGPSFDRGPVDEPVCRLSSSCTRQDQGYESRCGPYEVKLGWDKDGCEGGGSYYGRSICCPASEAVTKCVWRGEESDGGCNGQCQPGETQLWQSPWGNKPDRCKRGTKAFCCQAIEYSLVTRGCHWKTCGVDCNPITETRVTGMSKRTGPRTLGEGLFCLAVNHYCCPKDNLLSDCVWRGTAPDCGNAQCKDDEIVVNLDPFGNSLERCRTGRNKIACCKANAPPVTPEAPSPGGVCKPEFDWCAANPVECALEDMDPEFGEDDAADFAGAAAGLHVLAERGTAREIGKVANGVKKMLSQPYPSRGELITKTLGKSVSVGWLANERVCDIYNTGIAKFTATSAAAVPKALDTEHVIDLQVIPQFAQTCVTGILPGGAISKFATIPAAWFNDVFMKDGMLPAGLPRVSPTSPEIRNAMKLIFEACGSDSNILRLLLADREMNQIKGKLVRFLNPMAPKIFQKALKDGAAGNREAAMTAISAIKGTFSVFSYLQHPEVSAAFHATADSIRAQFAIIASNTQGAAFLAERWDEYFLALLRAIVSHGHNWTAERLLQAARHYSQYGGTQIGTTVYAEQMRLVLFLSTQLGKISIKYKDEIIS
ncbi:glycosyl hydrolase family 71-domain-containing protein [Chaetomidium leptoderma]|uniref:Glycosyl hydrolase family 71-domain-containing protein n=1 Tax=Chaetomidium leptoderma TaxID=669021 RepID=A0AAN6VGV6_9PEZI|nr:glycosyl hydrolase family 71-domain-containing protein [Chaetomidium leptoderma]